MLHVLFTTEIFRLTSLPLAEYPLTCLVAAQIVRLEFKEAGGIQSQAATCYGTLKHEHCLDLISAEASCMPDSVLNRDSLAPHRSHVSLSGLCLTIVLVVFICSHNYLMVILLILRSIDRGVRVIVWVLLISRLVTHFYVYRILIRY